MTAILQEAEEPYCTLYALLAGCGPMRAGEALEIVVRQHRGRTDTARLHVS